MVGQEVPGILEHLFILSSKIVQLDNEIPR